MKITKNLAVITGFILLLLSCKTVSVSAIYKTYPNQAINSSLKEDEKYTKIITPYKKQIDSVMSQPVTYAEEDFTKTGYSSNEANLLADLILDYSKKYTRKNTMAEPDFCLLNLGGVRTVIPKGVVTMGTIFEVAPFENEVVFIQLDGNLMKEMFEYLGKEKVGHPLAGINIKYKNDLTYSAEIGGKPFDPNKTYWVVTNDYLMMGGDRMYFFTKSLNKIVPKIILRDVLVKEMKQYKILPDSKQERLQFEN